MLSAEPSLSWVRDDESGGYPLHIAVWHVSLAASLVLSALPCLLPVAHLSCLHIFLLAMTGGFYIAVSTCVICSIWQIEWVSFRIFNRDMLFRCAEPVTGHYYDLVTTQLQCD